MDHKIDVTDQANVSNRDNKYDQEDTESDNQVDISIPKLGTEETIATPTVNKIVQIIQGNTLQVNEKVQVRSPVLMHLSEASSTKHGAYKQNDQIIESISLSRRSMSDYQDKKQSPEPTQALTTPIREDSKDSSLRVQTATSNRELETPYSALQLRPR